MKKHRFVLDVETEKSRSAAKLDILCAFAARRPDGCRFKLHKGAPKPEPSRTVVTCVYCGHEYPDGTPTAKAEALTAHVKACEKHPMKRLINALAALVGSRSKTELLGMREQIAILPTDADEKRNMTNAIDVLIETLP